MPDLGNLSFSCKVTSIHPFFDPFGNEFVCVEFSMEAQRPPNVISMPSNATKEMSMVMPIISQIPKIFPQSRIYSNRLILYFTTQEWDRLLKKYRFGDEVEVTVEQSGTIHVTPI
jgi:hypothetical protein